MAVLKIVLGDVVRMRKTHPCGNDQWEVVRLGADIGIRCLKCGRRVLMPRVKFERRIRTFIRRGEGAEEARPGASGSGRDDAPGRQGGTA